MATGDAILAELNRRLPHLESRSDQIDPLIQLPHGRAINDAIGTPERHVESWTADPPLVKSAIELLVDSKAAAAASVAVATATSPMIANPAREQRTRPILESKAIQDVGRVNDAKGY